MISSLNRALAAPSGGTGKPWMTSLSPGGLETGSRLLRSCHQELGLEAPRGPRQSPMTPCVNTRAHGHTAPCGAERGPSCRPAPVAPVSPGLGHVRPTSRSFLDPHFLPGAQEVSRLVSLAYFQGLARASWERETEKSGWGANLAQEVWRTTN